MLPTPEEDAFDVLIPPSRPKGGVHPQAALDLELQLEEEFTKGKSRKDIFSIDHLSYAASAAELAWECLRRNRFYQAHFDRAANALPETLWGNSFNETEPRSHGLVKLKDYREPYSDGAPPQWRGYHDFLEQFPKTEDECRAREVTLKLKEKQVAVVFDLGNTYADESPYDQQIFMAMDYLQTLYKRLHPEQVERYRSPTITALVRKLKVFDLLGLGVDIKEVETKLAYLLDQKQIQRLATPSTHIKNSIFDVKDEAKPKLKPKPRPASKAKSMSGIYEDANEAYQLIYRHGYLRLLRGQLFLVDENKVTAYEYDDVAQDDFLELRKRLLKSL